MDSALSLLNSMRMVENVGKKIASRYSIDIFSLNFKLLCSIYRLGSPSQSDIVRDLCIAKSNIASMAKEQIKSGLVDTHGDEIDGRIVYYSLTKEGEEYVKKALDCFSSEMESLPQNKLDRLDKNIKKIEEILSQIDKERYNA